MGRVSSRGAAAAALLAASVLLALAILVSACGSAAIWPGAKQGAAPKVAPAFSGVTLDGKAVTLDQFRGKPLLLVYMSPT